MRLWYLRRAIPWPPVAVCVAAAVALVAAAHVSPATADLVLPLAALVAVAATCFLFDEPAVAVTAVTARSGRWTLALRASVAALPLGAGLALLLTAPADVRGDRGDWALVLAGLAAAVMLIALARARRQLPQPSSPLASLVVLCGLAPLVAGPFLQWRSPYPQPELSDAWRVFWAGAAGTGAIGALAVALNMRWAGVPARGVSPTAARAEVHIDDHAKPIGARDRDREPRPARGPGPRRREPGNGP